jgi:hypothetical protein
MGDTWIPEDVFSMEPFARNFFENTSTVQVSSSHLGNKVVLQKIILSEAFYSLGFAGSVSLLCNQ